MTATERFTDLSTQSARHADARIVLGPDSIDLTVTPFRVRISARGVACLVMASAAPAALLWAAANSVSVNGYVSVAATVLVYLGTLAFLLFMARHGANPGGGARALPAVALPPALPRQDPGHQLRGSPEQGEPSPPLAAGDLGQPEPGGGFGAPLA